jgi:hypothetical protein
LNFSSDYLNVAKRKNAAIVLSDTVAFHDARMDYKELSGFLGKAIEALRHARRNGSQTSAKTVLDNVILGMRFRQDQVPSFLLDQIDDSTDCDDEKKPPARPNQKSGGNKDSGEDVESNDNDTLPIDLGQRVWLGIDESFLINSEREHKQRKIETAGRASANFESPMAKVPEARNQGLVSSDHSKTPQPFTKSSQATCAYCEKCDTFFPYNHKTNSKSNVTHKTSCPGILQTTTPQKNTMMPKKNTTPKKKAMPLLPTQSDKTQKLEEELQASQAEIEKLKAAADAESARLKALSEQKAAAEQKALLAAQEVERLKAMSEGTKTLLETLSSRIDEQEKEQKKLSKKQIDMGDEMIKKLNDGIGRIENLITAGAKEKKKHKKKRKRRDSDSDSDSSSDDGRKAKKSPHWYAPPFPYPSFPPPYGTPHPPPPPHGHLGNQQNQFY